MAPQPREDADRGHAAEEDGGAQGHRRGAGVDRVGHAPEGEYCVCRTEFYAGNDAYDLPIIKIKERVSFDAELSSSSGVNSVGPPCRGIREEDVDAGEVEEEDEGERDEERLPGAVGGEGADRGALVARLEGDLRLWNHQ